MATITGTATVSIPFEIEVDVDEQVEEFLRENLNVDYMLEDIPNVEVS